MEAVRGAVKNGTLAHAHLITGEEGIGKSAASREIARLILDPDGKDRRENLVDITEIHLKEKSIGVDEVRNIISESGIKPFEGDRKVIIINDGEKMTVQAQNALLKTVEEPPEGVYFIITALKRDDLLPTISSRCQVVNLHPLTREEMAQYLRKNYTVPEERLPELINISQGIPGRADDFLNDENDRNLRESMIRLMEKLAPVKSLRDRNSVHVLSMNRIIKEDPRKFFQGLVVLIRDMALIKSIRHYKNLIFLYNEERIRECAKRYSMTRLMSLLEISREALSLLGQGKNINTETVTDYTLLRMLEDKPE